MALITITAPGDIVGLMTAAFNAQAETARAITAIAQDQSPEGRRAAAALNEVFAPAVAAIKWGNQKLGIEPQPSAATPTQEPTK